MDIMKPNEGKSKSQVDATTSQARRPPSGKSSSELGGWAVSSSCEELRASWVSRFCNCSGISCAACDDLFSCVLSGLELNGILDSVRSDPLIMPSVPPLCSNDDDMLCICTTGFAATSILTFFLLFFFLSHRLIVVPLKPTTRIMVQSRKMLHHDEQ
jgi:hypothetical protein